MELKSTVNYNSIIEVDTFLFNMPVEYALGHCVAQDMRMSAGIAVHFKLIFGRIGELMDYRANVGEVAYLIHNNRFIFYLITKKLSHNKPTYDSLTEAITMLRDLVVKHDIKKLALPRIGCGLDSLDWSRVKNIIRCLFKNVDCIIKICHFSQNMSKEKEMVRIEHPNTIRVCKNIQDMKKRKFEQLNIILYSRKTTLPVFWDHSFQSVNEKYCFKSLYFKSCEVDNLEVGHCFHFEIMEAHIYVIITNKNSTEQFSYQNLEEGLVRIKNMIKNNQSHPTFIVHKINDSLFENLVNRKIMSLLCSAFLELTPCVIFELDKKI